MPHRFFLFDLVLLIGFIIFCGQSDALTNLTSTDKLLCYSCKGSQCESITNEEENIILCNKYNQLCWAGFVDQQPYRTCASRYCTPAGISLDSDIRIEHCCHSNLCNTVPLSWSIMSRWYRKGSGFRGGAGTAGPTEMAGVDSTSSRPSKSRQGQSRLYFVNDIVNGNQKPGSDQDDDQERLRLAKLQWNASDPESFGINWERIPYDKDFSIPVASISKLLVLLMPILLVLLL